MSHFKSSHFLFPVAAQWGVPDTESIDSRGRIFRPTHTHTQAHLQMCAHGPTHSHPYGRKRCGSSPAQWPRTDTSRTRCACVLLNGQCYIIEPGDNEALDDWTTMCVQVGHGLLLFTEPRAVSQTLIISWGGCVPVCQLSVPMFYYEISYSFISPRKGKLKKNPT